MAIDDIFGDYSPLDFVVLCFSGSELDRMKRQLDEGEQNIQLLQTENEVRLAKIQASQSAEADIDELVHDMNLEEESEDSEYEYEEESDD